MSGMHLAPAIVEGPEQFVGMVRRYTGRHPLLTLKLSNAERCFLLLGLGDITRAIEGVFHPVVPGAVGPVWTRDQVRTRVMGVRTELARGKLTLLLVSSIDRAVLRFAVEHNPYFAQMHDGDYRLTAQQISAAEALRARVAHLLGEYVAPVPLGEGRAWIGERAASEVS